MGLAFDMIAGYATNPSTTFTALTAATGDSFTVRNGTAGAAVKLEEMIRKGGTAGVLRVRSPLLHDDVQGIRVAAPSGATSNLLVNDVEQSLIPQDTLTVETTGGAAETDVGVLGVYYADLPGTSARLHMLGDIAGIVQYVLGFQVAAAAGGSAGAWGDTVINATETTLKANSDYAVLGYELDTAVAGVAIKGSDTGNLRIGGPGLVDAFKTRRLFVELSEQTGTPHIPVFNSANQDGTYVSIVDTAASTSVNVTLILAKLAQNIG